MDFLDIAMGHYNQTHTGKYYEEIPDVFYDTDANIFPRDQQIPAIPFDYEYIDNTTWAYKQLISNLTELNGAVTSIKTREQLKWKVGSFAALMDGRLYVIKSVSQDRSTANKESARLLPVPLGTEYILHLVEYENPRRLA